MSTIDERVAELVKEYGAATASAAHLFCDRHDPARVAFTVSDADVEKATSYGELAADSIRLAHALRDLGVGPGDRVATLLGKGAELVTTMIATWRLGAVYVPLFTAFATPAITYRITGAGAKVIITDSVQRPKLHGEDGPDAPFPCSIIVVGDGATGDDLQYSTLLDGASGADLPSVVQGGDGALVHTFTSGTTGDPKGVIHPLAYVAGWSGYLEFALGVVNDDVYWCAADPGWAYGLYAAIIAPLGRGCGTILQASNFSPDSAWHVISRLGVTNFSAAPTVYRALRATPDEQASAAGASLQRLSSAGEPLTPDVNQWSTTALGLEVHDHFGQTEVGMIFANPHHPLLETSIRDGVMGSTLPGWSATVIAADGAEQLEVGEVGRLAIDVPGSPFMTFTDYQDPRQTASRFEGDGRYYVLGDLGAVDAGGAFRFSSRDDDVIIMAGYRIGPFDIESVLSRHPSVAECAVVAAPDEMRGEVVEAFVVLRAEAQGSPDLVEELQTLVKTQYAQHAYPRSVHFVEQLPKTPSGKIQRFVLREQRRAEEKAKTPA